MAERTLTVRLKALIGDYETMMDKAKAKAVATAAGIGASLEKIAGSSQVKSLGGSLERNVSLPLALAGAGSVKLAKDFDTTFGQMTTLAGVAGDEVGSLKDKILALSESTGRGPQELAEGLYFASSAGYDTATALSIVTASAKASAVGLGDTQTVVQSVTAALGTYGTANLTAAKATDVLLAGAKSATVEAKDIAPQLGRILPIANLLGVTFDQVVGSLAYLTQGNNDASLSATELAGVLQKLLTPSSQGQLILEKYGLSVKMLKDAIASGGLPAALDLVKSKLGGNSQELQQLFDDVQAFNGASQLLANTNGNLSKSLDATAASAGGVDTAFGNYSKSDAAKLNKAFAELSTFIIRVGEVAGPVAAEVASAFGPIITLFGSMPSWLQATVVGLLGFVAAIGPLMRYGSGLIDTFKTLFSVVQKGALNSIGNLTAIGTTALGVGVIIGGLVAAWQLNKQEAAAARAEVVKYRDAIIEVGSVTGGAFKVLSDFLKSDKGSGLAKDLDAAGISALEFVNAVSAGGKALDDVRTRLLAVEAQRSMSPQVKRELDDLGISVDELVTKAAAGQKSLTNLGGATASIPMQNFFRGLSNVNSMILTTSGNVAAASTEADALGRVLDGTGQQAFTTANAMENDLANGIGHAADAADHLTSSTQSAEDALKAVLSEVSALYAGAFAVADATTDWSNAMDDASHAGDAAAGSARDLTSEQRSLEKASKDVATAQDGVRKAEEALALARAGATAREKHDADLDVKESALGVKQAQLAVTEATKKLREERAKTKDADVKGAQLALTAAQLAYQRALDRSSDSQAAQNELLHSGEEGSKKVTSAIDDVSKANDALVDAQQRVADAEKSLRSEAGTGGPVADRQRKIAEATQTAIDKTKTAISTMIEQKRPASEVTALIDTMAASFHELEGKNGDANGQLHATYDWLKKIFLVAKELPDIGNGLGGNVHGVTVGGGGQIIDSGLPDDASTPGSLTSLSTAGSTVSSSTSTSTGPAKSTVSAPLVVQVDRQTIAAAVVQSSQQDGALDIKILNH